MIPTEEQIQDFADWLIKLLHQYNDGLISEQELVNRSIKVTKFYIEALKSKVE